MNKKISKITTWLAAAVFLFALAINVKVTLDDPFTFINNEAIASGSSGGSPCGTSISANGTLYSCGINSNYMYGTITTTYSCTSGTSGGCSTGTVTTTYYCDGTSTSTGNAPYKDC